MSKPFKGTISVDVRDSIPDWEPYLPPQAKPGAPNVLYIVLDDTGIGALDAFGGLIEMPNLRRIAKLGLRFSNWHTTALCSPSRSCFLTGRNAHLNSMACITEANSGFPGGSAVIPPENGTLAEILLENGYSTYCVGKWHLTPGSELTMASSRRTWPLGRGFEQFYGFLGGETNQWYPDLVCDNHSIEPPYTPEQGYHLSKDLVDRAIAYIRDGNQVIPEKPWFMYLSFGANHAPHHVWKQWSDRYKGKFDMGYEKYREIVLENMKREGLIPQDTALPPINTWPAPDVIPSADVVLPWDSLSDEQKRLFARMAEVYAGFASYTDDQIGRLLDYLEESGQLDNTLIVAMSDNGASGEGSPNGSVNENKFFNGWPDDLQENLKFLDVLGSPETYNHYPTGWALAFNAPYKMFKRYSLEGGVADPLIIAFPKETRAYAGQVRDQYHHAIDIVPTVIDCCGVDVPGEIKGYAQTPIQGVSMRYTFSDPKAKSTRKTQYYAMLGTRAIYDDGWKAVARHGALSGRGDFMHDKWELYHTEVDRSETTDLNDEAHRDRLLEMIALWFAEAGRNNVLPLDDRTALEQGLTPRPAPSLPRDTYVYYPNTSEIPGAVAPNIRNTSFTIFADVRIDTPEAGGVIMAEGGRFGGHALFLKGGKLEYVYNFLGMAQQKIVSDMPVPAGRVRLGVEFTKTGENPKFVANGVAKLYVGDKSVGEANMRTQPGGFTLAGGGLFIGRSSADAVTDEYAPPAAFTGGTIHSVSINIKGEKFVDLEMEGLRALSRD